jgi:membrane associated rhomboid family serine protease
VAILVANLLCFVALASGSIPEGVLDRMVLADWSPLGFLGYQFLHAGLGHLIGNMVMLWVFGNALSGVMHDLDYVLAYLSCGVFAGMLHLAIDSTPVVGASGAISGVMGMYLAVYPKNEVTCFCWFFRIFTFELKGYILVIGWFVWDVISAIRGEPGIASWAHVGGTVAGFFIGILLLKLQRVYLGEYDNPTALDLLPQRDA